ncbi:hypothetical protein GCM10009589_34950 [Arthrobacter pascens]
MLCAALSGNLTVELDIDAADGQQRVSFWMTEDVGKRLGSFLANLWKPSGPPDPGVLH